MDSAGPPQMPVLKKNGFCLHDQDFGTSSGHRRIECGRLTELFNPERLRLQREQKWAREEVKHLFCKDFFVSQLRWYGIAFKSTARSADLEVMLRAAVADGKCTEVPESVRAIERSMRADSKYAEELRVWRRQLDEWNAAKKKEEDGRWAACVTPGQQASENLNKFMVVYFLDDQGNPDHTKTPNPMALHGFTDRHLLHEKVNGVPGLETASGGDGSSRTICIGWGRNAVWALARRLDEESRIKLTKETAHIWDQGMEEHKKFAELVKREGLRVNPKSIQPPNLQKCRGSYLIKCEEADQWSSQHLFTLDVATGSDPWKQGPFITLGRLELAHFEGTMLLSLSRFSLDTHIQRIDEDNCNEDDDEEDDDEEDENEEDGDEEEDEDDCEDYEEEDERDEDEVTEDTGSYNNKRKATSTGGTRGRCLKKARKDSAPARRIHLSLRGRETGEGQIFPEPKDGYIDFTDDLFTHFHGVMGLPYVGEEISFEGFKISHIAKKSPESWESFSNAAYESANAARWR